MNDRDWSFYTDSGYTILSKLGGEPNNAPRLRHNIGMNIVILDDYQDAVRKLECAAKLDALCEGLHQHRQRRWSVVFAFERC